MINRKNKGEFYFLAKIRYKCLLVAEMIPWVSKLDKYLNQPVLHAYSRLLARGYKSSRRRGR